MPKSSEGYSTFSGAGARKPRSGLFGWCSSCCCPENENYEPAKSKKGRRKHKHKHERTPEPPIVYVRQAEEASDTASSPAPASTSTPKFAVPKLRVQNPDFGEVDPKLYAGRSRGKSLPGRVGDAGVVRRSLSPETDRKSRLSLEEFGIPERPWTPIKKTPSTSDCETLGFENPLAGVQPLGEARGRGGGRHVEFENPLATCIDTEAVGESLQDVQSNPGPFEPQSRSCEVLMQRSVEAGQARPESPVMSDKLVSVSSADSDSVLASHGEYDSARGRSFEIVWHEEDVMARNKELSVVESLTSGNLIHVRVREEGRGPMCGVASATGVGDSLDSSDVNGDGTTQNAVGDVGRGLVDMQAPVGKEDISGNIASTIPRERQSGCGVEGVNVQKIQGEVLAESRDCGSTDASAAEGESIRRNGGIADADRERNVHSHGGATGADRETNVGSHGGTRDSVQERSIARHGWTAGEDGGGNVGSHGGTTGADRAGSGGSCDETAGASKEGSVGRNDRTVDSVGVGSIATVIADAPGGRECMPSAANTPLTRESSTPLGVDLDITEEVSCKVEQVPFTETTVISVRSRDVKHTLDETSISEEMPATPGGGSVPGTPDWSAPEEDIDRLVAIHQHRTSLSSLGARSDSLASVYSGAGEGRYGTVAVKGEVEFSLTYNYKASALEITVKQCRDLAPVDAKRNRSDPYVKVYLLPDKSKSGKRKTKVKKHTLNPVFDETLKFSVSLDGLESRTLWLTVWHSDMFGRNDFLGEVMMSLENKVFDDPSPRWYPLCERTEPFEDLAIYKGDIIIGLKFVPPDVTVVKKGKRSRGSLHVLVKEAKNLTAVKASGLSDPFCKCYLLPDKGRSSKQKTPVVRRNCNPSWNYTFVYEDVSLQDLSERCLELTVWDHDRLASNEFLGGLRFCLGTGKHFGKPVDWMDATGKELTLWQSMLERPNFWVEGSITLRPSLDHPNGPS